MKYAKIADGVVVQIQPNDEEGFIEVKDDVVCGQTMQEDGTFKNPPIPELSYAEKRMREYPPAVDYLDGVVKGDATQVQKYIDDCKAVKAKYPKPV